MLNVLNIIKVNNLNHDESLICEKATDIFGKGIQCIVAIEEFAELTKELCKIIQSNPKHCLDQVNKYITNYIENINDFSACIKDCCKNIRKLYLADISHSSITLDKSNDDHVSEELADVDIMMEQLMYIFNPLDSKIKSFRAAKLKKLKERLEMLDIRNDKRSDPKKAESDPIQK